MQKLFSEIWQKFTPPKNWFKLQDFLGLSKTAAPVGRTSEHGSLTNFGRDIAERVARLVKDVDEFTGFSRLTSGLDANLSNVPVIGDVVKGFQDSLKAIVPGLTKICLN